MSKRRFESDKDVVDLTTSSEHVAGSSHPSSQPQQPVQAYAGAHPSLSRPKKRRKTSQNSDASLPERRGAVFKKSCPKNTLERVARVMSQRFFMIDRRRESDGLCEEFKVLGSTGNVCLLARKSNVELVNISSRFMAGPDASRGNHCKHILFIFLKVLQVPQSSGLWYQKALLASELQTIFANAPQAPNALAHDSVRDAYARATGKAPQSASSTAQRRIPGPDDSCPICYESMHGVSQNILTFCEECGNGLHSECFEQWRRSAAVLTCVWCRAKWPAKWPGDNQGKFGAGPIYGGYINLARAAGLSGIIVVDLVVGCQRHGSQQPAASYHTAI
ncbi:hypothetical protein B0F90DRAFT_1813275 [Multifurca ochricompacta]|uniref:RING-type domain-containing protein n=1 Tax=Multifurca ochricompacta TaxID=376703 RepID=A0AAD4MD49_9AGAM|nr:hypothetical protein B0F90DRAFT_1813275 [Multifurca ochricompacta]